MQFLTNTQPNPIYADEKCAICIEPYDSQKNECLSLKCGHIYHTVCVKEYFEQQADPKCPICRADVIILSKDTLDSLGTRSTMRNGAIKTAQFFCGIGVILFGAGLGTMIGNHFIPGRREAEEAYLAENPPYFIIETPQDFLNAALVIGTVSIGFFLVKNQIVKYNMRKNSPQEILYTPPPVNE